MLRKWLRITFGSVIAAALVFSVFSSSALAADWDLTLGAGVGGAPDYEGLDEHQAVPLFLARIDFGQQSIELREP